MEGPTGPVLVYVADPMCSWCWGFAPELARIQEALEGRAGFELVLGGLAPDDAEPMDDDTRRYVQGAWDAVEARTGVRFNRDFWTRCTPRRSTWPACRAVLAAETLVEGAGWPMFQALQRAYYLEARNPSEVDTLTAVFEELRGKDAPPEGGSFRSSLDDESTHRRLAEHLARRDALGVRSFPGLLWVEGSGAALLARGWAPAEAVLERLESVAGLG